jgi:large subunit ribosomal protein L1
LDHKGGIMAESKKSTKTGELEETKKKQLKHAEVVVETVPTEGAPKSEIVIEKITTKAGKRSPKAVKQAQTKEAKEARKQSAAPEVEAKQADTARKSARSKAERAGKKYKQAYKLIDKNRVYPMAEALELAIKTSATKFDSSIEMHINLGVDPKLADQNVRDTVSLPAGTGKDIRVITLSTDAEAEKLFAKLDKEDIDFDVLIAVPAMMPQLGKYARLLGPRGLMPSPKSGTVTQNVKEAAEQAKAGRVEYRVDQSGIIHLSVGKVSFGANKLQQNADAVMASVRAAKPASLKGIYIKSIYLTTTMGPSIKSEI